MITNKPISISFKAPLFKAFFLERPNRYIVRCRLDKSRGEEAEHENYEVVEAHLADPGRLKEVLIPGRILWLSLSDRPNRKTKWSVTLSETPDSKGLISMISTLPNHLIRKALAAGVMEEFKGWSLEKSEFKKGNSRWDFLLADPAGNRQVLEVKSVTLARDRLGLFPDAVTTRGVKHLKELAQIQKEKGWEAGALFVAQREDIDYIRAAEHIDPKFAAALKEARDSGVQIFARKCRINLEEITLGERIQVL